jgi:hypothetical protein
MQGEREASRFPCTTPVGVMLHDPRRESILSW